MFYRASQQIILHIDCLRVTYQTALYINRPLLRHFRKR